MHACFHIFTSVVPICPLLYKGSFTNHSVDHQWCLSWSIPSLFWLIHTLFTAFKRVWINQNKKRYGLTKTLLTVHAVCLHFFPDLQTFHCPRNNKQHWVFFFCPTVHQLTDVRMVCYALLCLPVDAKPQKFAVEHPLAFWLLNPFFLSFKYTRIDS